jgi:hypothetical protein
MHVLFPIAAGPVAARPGAGNLGVDISRANSAPV